MKIYCLFDRLADRAGPIFESENDGTACRSISQVMKSTVNPEDYQLYYLGTFNDGVPSINKVEEFHQVPYKYDGVTNGAL